MLDSQGVTLSVSQFVTVSGSDIGITGGSISGKITAINGSAITVQTYTMPSSGQGGSGSDSSETITYVKAANWLVTNPANTQNLNGTATFPGAATVTVTFSAAEPDANYLILLGPKAAETIYVSAQTTSGFTLTSSNGSSTAKCDWKKTRAGLP